MKRLVAIASVILTCCTLLGCGNTTAKKEDKMKGPEGKMEGGKMEGGKMEGGKMEGKMEDKK